MREILREFMTGLSRWPLLMGAVICFALALYEETVTDNSEVLIGVGGLVVGCMLLGGWLVSYIVEGEREHYRVHRPVWADEPPKEGSPPERSDSEGRDPSEGDGSLP